MNSRRWLTTTNSSWHLLSSTTHKVLSLSSIFTGILLDALKTLTGSFTSDVFDLCGLGRNDFRGMFQLAVNDVPVLDVDQRGKIDDASAQERESP